MELILILILFQVVTSIVNNYSKSLIMNSIVSYQQNYYHYQYERKGGRFTLLEGNTVIFGIYDSDLRFNLVATKIENPNIIIHSYQGDFITVIDTLPVYLGYVYIDNSNFVIFNMDQTSRLPLLSFINYDFTNGFLFSTSLDYRNEPFLDISSEDQAIISDSYILDSTFNSSDSNKSIIILSLIKLSSNIDDVYDYKIIISAVPSISNDFQLALYNNGFIYSNMLTIETFDTNAFNTYYLKSKKLYPFTNQSCLIISLKATLIEIIEWNYVSNSIITYEISLQNDYISMKCDVIQNNNEFNLVVLEFQI